MSPLGVPAGNSGDRDVPVEARYEHFGLLGTVIDIRVKAVHGEWADRANARVVEEITRLERVSRAFDPDSELRRWRRREVEVVSPEFAELMVRTLEWQIRSDGGFNPLAGELSALWQRAVRMSVPPGDAELAGAAAAIRAPRHAIVDGAPIVTGDCSALDLNAIAKGYIVDRALDAAMTAGIEWVSFPAESPASPDLAANS